MRDAFGGSFMLMIFIVFIFIYICFTAVSLNYAKAFKVKNAIISYLEESEIEDLDGMTATELQAFENFIDKEIVGNKNYDMSRYNICQEDFPIEDGSSRIKKDESGERIIGRCYYAGIQIRESEQDERTGGYYYTVSTYLGWDIGFLSKLASLNGNRSDPETGKVTGTWRISGQTRLIVNLKPEKN